MYDYDFIAREAEWEYACELEAEAVADIEWDEDDYEDWHDDCDDGEDAEEPLWWDEPADLEMGFNPYIGCYDYDC